MDETRAAAQRDLAAAAAMKPAEKRRRFFMRKQTNSAPDSFDGVTGHIPPPKPKEHHSVSFCLGNVRKCRGSDSSIQPPVLPTISVFGLGVDVGFNIQQFDTIAITYVVAFHGNSSSNYFREDYDVSYM
ncbi:Protein of unknown function [Gryllus bimaculatus]|nr:Protein of unknown function [Gryllus bimaculatus]